MNENQVIQCVLKVSKSLLSKFVILTVMFCMAGLVTAQNSVMRVSGTVVSENENEPLAGVSIKVKGVSMGTVTDEILMKGTKVRELYQKLSTSALSAKQKKKFQELSYNK